MGTPGVKADYSMGACDKFQGPVSALSCARCLWTRESHVTPPAEKIVKPNHYVANLNGREYEVADVCEAFDLNLRLGQVVQYILREKHKGGLEDLKKAKRWLGREIAKREGREGWE